MKQLSYLRHLSCADHPQVLIVRNLMHTSSSLLDLLPVLPTHLRLNTH